MSNSIKFHETWKRHRLGVHELRDAYEQRLRTLDAYQGSKGYNDEVAKAQKAFKDGLDGLRGDSRSRFERIFADLEQHVEPETMQPPTAEQLQLLQMLELRESLDMGELEQAAKALANNDAAVSTLADIAMRKGRILPPGVKSKAAQRRFIIDTLRQAVGSLMEWDGRTRSEVMRDHLSARNNYRWGDGAPVPFGSLASLDVADIEAGAGAADTLRELVPRVDYGTLSAFMNE